VGELLRLYRRPYRRRDRAYVSRAAPPLQREATEREHAEQGAEEGQPHPQGGRAGLEPGGCEGNHETNDRRREPYRQEDAREPGHAKASVEDRKSTRLNSSHVAL